MAIVKELTVSKSRTVGLPGYSSIKAEAFITLELDEGEDYNNVYKHAWKVVDDQIFDRLKDYLPADEDPGQDWLRKDPDNVVKTREKAEERRVASRTLKTEGTQ